MSEQAGQTLHHHSRLSSTCDDTFILYRLCKEVMQHPVFAVSQAFVAGMQELFILLSKTWTFEGEKDLVGRFISLPCCFTLLSAALPIIS